MKLLNVLPDGTEVWDMWVATPYWALLTMKRNGITFKFGQLTYHIPLSDKLWEGRPIKIRKNVAFAFKPTYYRRYKRRLRNLR